MNAFRQGKTIKYPEPVYLDPADPIDTALDADHVVLRPSGVVSQLIAHENGPHDEDQSIMRRAQLIRAYAGQLALELREVGDSLRDRLPTAKPRNVIEAVMIIPGQPVGFLAGALKMQVADVERQLDAYVELGVVKRATTTAGVTTYDWND